MPEAAPGRIGPNAILQYLPVLQAVGARHDAMAQAGLGAAPGDDAMIPEADAARLHRAVRALRPQDAPRLAAKAGQRTADYILAHRIPRPAQRLLRALPAPLAARLLSRAIAQHAWTFAGSGTFRVLSPWSFEIADNPLCRDEPSDHPLCHWHAAVFQRLYRVLVAPDVVCVETRCGAMPGETACRFELRRSATARTARERVVQP